MHTILKVSKGAKIRNRYNLFDLDIDFWTSGLISSFFLLYYSYLSSNVSYTRPIPLGAFVTCL